MSQSRAGKLGALALSNLKLPTTDVAEELVNSFRTFLAETDNTKDVVRSSKPKKRTSIVKDFLNSNHSSGKTNKRYFWPARQTTITESVITEELATFMCLDVGKIPRRSSGVGKPNYPTAHPKPVGPHPVPHLNSQEGLQEIKLAAAAAKLAMDKLDKQDPTYYEDASDFVQDTSRETRQVNKNLSTSSQAQLLSSADLASGTPTLDSLTAAIPAHDEAKRRVAESKRANTHSLSASSQIRTPPPSDQRLGKRPAREIDIFEIPDDEMSFPEPLLETDLPGMCSPYAGPSRKRARFDTTPEAREVLEHITAPANLGPRPPTGNSVQRARQPLDQAVETAQIHRQSARVRDTTTSMEDSSAAPVSPPSVCFESFYPSSPRSTADVAVQCQNAQPEAGPGDQIMIDLRELQFAQLYDLPSIFLDKLGELRKSYETVGTNEGRARAAVLRDVEDHFRKMLEGP